MLNKELLCGALTSGSGGIYLQNLAPIPYIPQIFVGENITEPTITVKSNTAEPQLLEVRPGFLYLPKAGDYMWVSIDNDSYFFTQFDVVSSTYKGELTRDPSFDAGMWNTEVLFWFSSDFKATDKLVLSYRIDIN